MQLPVPPTDSLYKFMALFGLVLIALGIVTPIAQLRDTNTQIYQARREAATLKVDNRFLLEDQKVAAKQARALRIQNRKKLAVLTLTLNPVQVRARELQRKQALLSEQLNLISHLQQDNTVVLQVFSGITLTGVLVAFVGFVSWYFKSQRHQDIILQCEAKAALEGHVSKPSPGAAEQTSENEKSLDMMHLPGALTTTA